MPGFAFFDFDNTLIHGDAGPLFARHLWSEHGHDHGRLRTVLRYTPFAAWMGVQAAFYRIGAVRRSRIVRSAYRGFKGVPEALLRSEMATFVDQAIPPRIYPRMVQEIRDHQEAGRRVVVITTGMEGLVRAALRHFPPGMDLIGCILEVEDGVLTGRVMGPLYGADKANILRAYAHAAGVDPRDCWAYSDHVSDRHMLEAVGQPVCVNPRGRLRQLALRRAWRILELEDPRTGTA